jgi:D-serine deaminase-like pyridoxal phosphate-dependent protein
MPGGLAARVDAASQEHLKATVESGTVPAHGDPVLLLPRHADTTLAQFDRVHLVGGGPVRDVPTVFRPF